jgi:trimeric autotransporter adhesin
MKTKIQYLLLMLACLAGVQQLFAQGTAFTYQGRLNNDNSPANGNYDLRFALFNTNQAGIAIAGPVTNIATVVSNGLLTTTVDFGANAFMGGSNWLEIAVQTNGGSGFVTLTPRQQVTPTPYALFAENADSLPGLLVQPNIDDAPNLIGGSRGNFVSSGTVGATIGGGGATNNSDFFLISVINSVGADFGTVSGGAFNTASGLAAVVGGGYFNKASTNFATVGGGDGNTAAGTYATVGGGFGNMASEEGATVSGGEYNDAGGNYSFAGGLGAQAVYDGDFVWADSQGEPLPTPFSSTAANQFLIRAGGGVGINMNNPNGASLYVQGNRNGGWGSSVGYFENASTFNDAGLGSSPALRVVVDGGSSPDGALSVSVNGNGTGPLAEFGNANTFVVTIQHDGTVISKNSVLTSDRNAKENFAALDGETVLAKVISLPVTEWNYKDDPADKKHIGPMAQDFYAAFDLNGADDKHISVVDEGGVALAAIQGLNQKLNDKDVEIQELKQSVDELKAMVKQLAAQK